MAKLVKSIYTGSDVTSLGELTSSDTVEDALIFADNVALKFGTNSDSVIQYDETTDDRLEITGAAVHFAPNVTIGTTARGTVTADNDGSFDLNASNLFTCTPTGAIDLTFTNETAGQTGIILLVNTTPQVVTVDADVFLSSADLTTINVAGTYLLGYYCPDGTNVYMSATPALTEGS
jgi:hypothetical protein